MWLSKAGVILLFLDKKQSFLSKLKPSFAHHRCVTHLYRIPLFIFNYALNKSILINCVSVYLWQNLILFLTY